MFASFDLGGVRLLFKSIRTRPTFVMAIKLFAIAAASLIASSPNAALAHTGFQTDDAVAATSSSAGEGKQTLRSPEAFLSGFKQMGLTASLNTEDPKMPAIKVDLNGETIMVSFSNCDAKGCNFVQLLDWAIGLSDKQVNAIKARSITTEQFSHPLWLEADKVMAFYNYLVIGTDGVTVQALIENMAYFIDTNVEILTATSDTPSK